MMMMTRLFRRDSFTLSLAAALLLLSAGCRHCVEPSRENTTNITANPPASKNSTSLRETMSRLDRCLIQSAYSYTLAGIYAPTSVGQLSSACAAQTEAFKCIKEGLKPLEAVLKRGLQVYLQSRQRHHKKLCSNVGSEQSRQFLRATECILDRRRSSFESNDSNYGNAVMAISQRNFNDSSLELKHLCCAFLNYRRGCFDNIGPQCELHRPKVEEMFLSMLPSQFTLICDDEETLFSKTCPSLEPLKVAKEKFVITPGSSPVMLTMYLLATLGEPEAR